MPDIDRIKQFNKVLYSLGSEPQILKERNEEPEDIPVSGSELSSDISDLLTSADTTVKSDTGDELDDISAFGGSDVSGTSDDIDASLGDVSIGDTSIDVSMDDAISASSDAAIEDASSADIFSEDADDIDIDTTEESDMSFEIPGLPETGGGDDTGFSDMSGFAEDTTPPDTSAGDTGIDTQGEDLDYFSLLDNLGTDMESQPGQDADTEITPDTSDITDASFGNDVSAADSSAADLSAGDLSAGDISADTDSSFDDFSLPDDTGADAGITSDSDTDFSFTDESGADSDDPSDIDFSLPDDAGAGLPPSDIDADFSLPEDTGADIGLPSDTGEDTDIGTGLPDDIPADLSLPDGFDIGAEPPADETGGDDSGFDFSGGLSLPDDTGADTGDFEQPSAGDEEGFSIDADIPGDIPDDFSIPEEPAPGSDKPKKSLDSFEISDDDDFFIDEFSISEGEEGIDVMPESGQKKGPEKQKSGFGEVLHEEEDISIPESQLQAIQKTLDTLPLNLKIKAEEAIGLGQATGPDLRELLDVLAKGAPATEIAQLVSRITGEKISLPKRFEKKTGMEFELERKSFSYVFRTNILPMLGIFIPVLIVTIILAIAGYNIKTWLDAQDQYRQGLRYIAEDKDFAQGNDEFRQAYEKSPDNKWYSRYAEAFIKENQYGYAEEKYEQLLGLKWDADKIAWMRNLDKKGILDYAGFESGIRGNYKKASTLLDFLLYMEPYNKEGLLASGDNFLEWAKEDPAKYKDANNAYAAYKSKYGETPEIMFKFLEFFIKTDNHDMVMELKKRFHDSPDIKIDPAVYADLAGYLLDYNQVDDVQEILRKANDVNPKIPNIHYQFARFFRNMDQPVEEEKALVKAKALYKDLPPLKFNEENIKKYIDSYNRLGELYYREKRTGLAEQEFDDAVKLIEDRQKKKLIGLDPGFGNVYYNRGNIFYDAKDFDTAFLYYEQAGNNLYNDPEMNFRKGYIDYRKGNYLDSLMQFYAAERGIRNNRNILFSIGNALYFRGDYFAAQGYYDHLLSVLEQQRAKIETLSPDKNPGHRSLLNFIMRTYNNLGVTLVRLSEMARNPAKESEGQVCFTKSIEHYDIIDRLIENPELMDRDKITKNLAYLNQRQLLYPQSGYELSIYNDIPVNPETLDIDDLFATKIEY